MAKRTALSTASDLMPLHNDHGKLHEALNGFDTVLIGDAFAKLLVIAASVEANIEKRRKLVRRSAIQEEFSTPKECFLPRKTH